jgi:hypothetical protein
MKSSSFKLNHAATDIDVLVVWEDDVEDATDRKKLPRIVISLRDIAKSAFVQQAGEGGE